MHPKNPHSSRYDLKALSASSPELRPFVLINKYNDESIDFANPAAVKALNRAILKHFYHVSWWDIPEGYLCPPIPGRADYIHYAAGLFPQNQNFKVLDIGVGANCVYPLIGNASYGWTFVGSDIDPKSIANAKKIVESNHLEKSIEIRLQPNQENIFQGLVNETDYFDLTICNPPFHESQEEASKGSARKWKNLKKDQDKQPVLNFGGISSELWTEGGEKAFVTKMIQESVKFKDQIKWYSTLISKEENLPLIYKLLKSVDATEVKTLDMEQGNKKSRIIAWKFK